MGNKKAHNMKGETVFTLKTTMSLALADHTCTFWLTPRVVRDFNQGVGAEGWGSFGMHSAGNKGCFAGSYVGNSESNRFNSGDLPNTHLPDTKRHYAFTYRNSDKLASFYIDGVLKKTKTFASSPGTMSDFRLGGVSGLIWDVRFYTAHKVDTEVVAIRDGAADTAGLQLWWKLLTDTKDYSANARVTELSGAIFFR